MDILSPVTSPDLIKCIIEAAYDDYNHLQTEQDTVFASLLVSISTISRAWYHETRPFLFKTATFTFGQDPASADREFTSRSARRARTLAAIVKANPRIARYVRRLSLWASDVYGLSGELDECGAVLLSLVHKLPNLSAFEMVWAHGCGRTGLSEEETDRWWTRDVGTSAKLAITSIMKLPTLTSLNLWGAPIPPELWVTNSALQTIQLEDYSHPNPWYARSRPCNWHSADSHEATKPAAYLIAESIHTSAIRPIVRGLTSPSTMYSSPFANLTDLCVGTVPLWIGDLQTLLHLNRRTLVCLRCCIVFKKAASREGAMMDRDACLSFQNLSALRHLYISVVSGDQEGFKLSCDCITRTLSAVPWAQLRTVKMSMVTDCTDRVPGAVHQICDVRPFVQSVDAEIARNLRGVRGAADTPMRYGPVHGSSCAREHPLRLTISHRLALCLSCRGHWAQQPGADVVSRKRSRRRGTPEEKSAYRTWLPRLSQEVEDDVVKYDLKFLITPRMMARSRS